MRRLLLLLELDSPLIGHKLRNDAKAGPTIGPFGCFWSLGNAGTEAAGVWRDANLWREAADCLTMTSV